VRASRQLPNRIARIAPVGRTARRGRTGFRAVAPGCLALCLTLQAMLLAGCSDASLQILPPPPVPALDDRLELAGTLCTQPASAVSFPVKIVVLIDLSNSMCYSDPASGACTALRCDQGPNNPATNKSPPRRAVAVQTLLQRYVGNAAVKFSIVTFSAAMQLYPPSGGFTSASALLGTNVLEALRNVDSVTDYQGAISRVKGIISDDLASVAKLRRSELPRTRYAVLFLTDGTPFPHCSRGNPATNDPPDNGSCPGAPETCTICQRGFDSSKNPFPGLTQGEDYNEPYQLVQLVDELHKLGEFYGVGDLKFHALQLRVDNAAICCPDCFVADPNGARAAALLTAMAKPDQGLGSYVLFRRASDLSFVDYDFTSLQQDFIARQVIVDQRNWVATPDGLALDSDGDGLSDDEEYALGTDPLKADTDGDGYSDLFEVRYRDRGFDPLVSQKARCQAHSEKCVNRSACDTDGDGLTDCEEFELGTAPELADSDADGIPDGLEVRRGMDPMMDDRNGDLDFDGATNLEELLRGTSPTRPDTRKSLAWQTSVAADEQGRSAQGGVCYQLQAHDLTLASPQSRQPAGQPIGSADTYVWLSEAPRGDARDFGRVRVACVRTLWLRPDVRLPLSPSLSLVDSCFRDPKDFRPDAHCVTKPCEITGDADPSDPKCVRKCP
jgi:hypothetical protein